MEATKCRTCGQKHWERVCPNPPSVPRTKGLPSFVTRPVTPVTKSVTQPVRSVTKNVTVSVDSEAEASCAGCKRLKSALKQAHVELEALTGEVAQLKRALAEARGGAPKPMTPAERARKMRAKRKDEQQFKG